jgi:membrane associated rhomboid family serine protease
MAQPFPPPPATPVRTCYRHAGQPAGVICQRCDRPICPACMHQASVGFHCPECIKKTGQKVYRGSAAMAGDRPILTQLLIALNVGVFIVGVLMTGGDAVTGFNELMIDGGLIARFPNTDIAVGVGDGEWYRMITAGFLHYGIIHLAFNMYALWILGGMLEKAVGRSQLAIIYGVSILGGSVGALLLSPDRLTVGASGGIFGLMGAVLAFGRSRGQSIRSSPVFPLLVLNLLITLGWSGSISVGGHLGGLVAGFIAGTVMFELPQRITAPRTGASRGSPDPGTVVGMALCVLLGLGLLVAGIAVGSAATL